MLIAFDEISEDGVFKDFTKEWDNEKAVNFICKLKQKGLVITSNALYWAEEINNG